MRNIPIFKLIYGAYFSIENDRKFSIVTRKICLAIERISNHSGGAEKVVVTLANGLNEAGFDVSIITWEHQDGLPFYPLDKQVEVINLMPIDRRRPPGQSQKITFKKRLIRMFLKAGTWPYFIPGYSKFIWNRQHKFRLQEMRRHFNEAKPDVVIGFLPSSFPYVVRAADGLDVKAVSSCHSVPERDFEDPDRWSQNVYDLKWRKKSLLHSDATTCLLDKFTPFFEKMSVPNLHVIPNFVETPNGKHLEFSRDSKTIIAVGRLALAKDHQTLLHAWAYIKDDYPDWKIHIYGTGPLRDALHDLHAQLGLGETLVFKGETKDVEEKYQEAEIFCIPSIYEGFGLVTGEAMANGLPVIGFDDCDGTNDLVIDGVTGILSKGSGDRCKNLANDLARLMSDQDKRREMGREGFDSIKRFSKDAAMAKWFKMLDSIGAG